MNDVLASSLNAKETYSAGVEFYEARFKRQFASRRCAGAGGEAKAKAGDAECIGAVGARKKMGDFRWQRQMIDGDVGPAKAKLSGERLQKSDFKLAHLCRMGEWAGAKVGRLRVPGNASAATASVYLAPQGLFSHFPYGQFFPAMRHCHDQSWKWGEQSKVERRLCSPQHRVPSLLVHMAGLRQEQWGRRSLVRALGAWLPAADAVAPDAWVSARAAEAASATTAEERRHAWSAVGRLLVTEGVPTHSFRSMGDFDHFAARLLLLGLLTRRRVVMPPIPCELRWMRRALEPRHLRGMEVGCGEARQCIWLPFPHHIDPLCAGIDYLNDYDYTDLISDGTISSANVERLPISTLHLSRNISGVVNLGRATETASPILRVTSTETASDPLGWIPLGGFKNDRWSATLPRRVEMTLRAPPPIGMGLNDPQMTIVRQCLRSLARSNE